MNPPSALQSAMNRERKPFTYLPGGLDLSEIKSQRMAQRLMRNAMNPGVPELPTPPASASATPTTTLPVPNFNCLPVQVFPTFQLPANPKSLLRTRSNPDPKMPSFLNPKSNTVNAQFQVNKPAFAQSQVNNGTINSTKPEACYENNSKLEVHNNNPFENVHCGEYLPKMEYVTEYQNAKPLQELNNIVLPSSYLHSSCKTADDVPKMPPEVPAPEVSRITSPPLLMTLDEDASNNEQKTTKITKEETTKKTTEKISSQQNGEQNGDAEAALTIKLPTKKSEAQSETKVEVVKKTLPDGSVQEITTTTTTTTIDGRTEIKTRTQTKTFPKELVEQEQDSEEEVVEENEDSEKEDQKSSIITNEERSEATSTKKVTVVLNDSSEKDSESNKTKEKQSDGNSDPNKQSSNNIEIEEIEEENEEEQEEVEEEQEQTKLNNEEKEEKQNKVVEETKEDNLENETVEENKEDSASEYEEIEEKENEEVLKTEPEKTASPPPNQDEESEYTEEEYESEVEEENKVEKDNIKEKTSTQEKTIQKDLGEPEETEPSAETAKDNEILDSKLVIEKEESVEQSDTKESPEEEKSDSNQEESSDKPAVVDTDAKNVEQSNQDTENSEEVHEIKVEVQEEVQEEKSRPKVQFREPSVPLEKVEDIEIKPITGQDFVTKSTIEKTEIITSSNEQPSGILSKQTNYNRVENIVKVNRTTKTLDKQLDDLVYPSYLTGNSTVAAPQVNKPYETAYTPEPTERRHSLLLERLSVERQLPITEIYRHPYTPQTSENKQWSDEPQSEVLTINNVKPSAITKNQQWYQYSKDNVNSYQNEQSAYQPWNPQQQPQVLPQYTPPSQYQPTQPQQTPPQPQYQPPQPQYQPPQPQYQPPQPQYQPPQQQYQAPLQAQYQPKAPQYQQQPLFHSQPSPQPQHTQQPKPQQSPQPQAQYPPYAYKPQPLIKPEQSYQSSYTENRTQETKSTSTFSPNVQRSTHAYTPKPDWNSNTSTQNYNQTSQYSETTDVYTPQSYSSSYVPPPWEQDSKYVTDNNFNNYETSPVTPTVNQSWTPTPQANNKFSKATPKAYIPPAPNQSFVKPVTAAPPKVAGRKTYYSEYERRYISVPESTYVPNETKFQHQPDPSPVYYYNTEETTETSEPEWRRELREFTEKTSKTQTHIESSARPPWEAEKAAKTSSYTPTPTWSQTLQPQSYQERSFESERYSSVQEWPKTNTIGRSRPLSSYEKSDYESPVQKVRGVSVDRYNPNSYQSPSPAEHPPVQSQTLTAENAPHKHYHNQNVPAYHASRASAEPRDAPPSYKQPRPPVDSRTPIQSRSFKYLQWITGTED